jgi:small subunit ribosomal protein S17e
MQHLMRRLERGDQVRGISLKLQEEERERRMDYVPEVSALSTDRITVDPETAKLLEKLDVTFPGGVTVENPQKPADQFRGPRRPVGDRPVGEAREGAAPGRAQRAPRPAAAAPAAAAAGAR